MRPFAFLCGGAVLVVLAGCASNPDEQMTYYFPKTRIDVAVTQTIGCYKDQKTVNVRSIASATVATTYLADYSDAARHQIAYRAFDGALRDADTGVTLTSDGQLSGLNASVTGEGGAVIKSAVALAGIFTGVSAGGGAAANFDLQIFLPNVGLPRENRESPQEQLCDLVKAYAAKSTGAPGGGTPRRVDRPPAAPGALGDGDQTSPDTTDRASGDGNAAPTLSLTFKRRIEYTEDSPGGGLYVSSAVAGDSASVFIVPPDPSSQFIFDAMKKIPGLTLDVSAELSSSESAPSQPTLLSGTFPDKQMLKVPAQDRRHLTIQGPAGDLSHAGTLWDDDVVIPTRQAISVPITKANIFGKSQTGVTLGPSGLVQKLEYSKTSEAAALIGGTGQIAGQAEGRTEAQKAAAVQSQADLIYQQQRLITCQLTPKSCASK